jgi:hypothetical protein
MVAMHSSNGVRAPSESLVPVFSSPDGPS